MLANPQIYLIFVLVSFLLYWSLPRDMPAARAVVLVLISGVAIFIASPLALVVTGGMIVTVLAAVLAMDYLPRTLVLWGGIVAIVSALMLAEARYSSWYATIGLSYVALKSISVIVDHWDQGPGKAKPGVLEVFLLNVFFPIFSAGPIERLQTFKLSNLSNPFDYRYLVEGLGRITLGLLKTSYVSGALINPYIDTRFAGIGDNPGAFQTGDFYGYVLLKFLSLYVNFSGYTDIAVGTGRLFSLRIMENFRYPFLASNIQEFWQRWHLSLGAFVNRYLFMWFVRWTNGSVELSLICSFLLVGLWHDVTGAYFIWGVLHGVGLAVVARLNRLSVRHSALRAVRANVLYGLCARALTIFFAAWVYTFANSGGTVQGIAITMGLLGG